MADKGDSNDYTPVEIQTIVLRLLSFASALDKSLHDGDFPNLIKQTPSQDEWKKLAQTVNLLQRVFQVPEFNHGYSYLPIGNNANREAAESAIARGLRIIRDGGNVTDAASDVRRNLPPLIEDRRRGKPKVGKDLPILWLTGLCADDIVEALQHERVKRLMGKKGTYAEGPAKAAKEVLKLLRPKLSRSPKHLQPAE